MKTLLANLPSHSTSAGNYHANDSLVIQFESDEPGKAPEVSDSLIRFNGNSELGHETFYLERVPTIEDPHDKSEDTVFAFCKTARKPYDLVVCGVLIVAAKHAGRYISVSSDGDLDDWSPAFAWVTSILGPEYRAAAVASRLLGGSINLGGEPEPDPTPDGGEPVTELVAEPEPVPEPKPEPVTTSHTIVVDVKEFRAALELSVSEKKSHIPILSTVCLQPHGSSLHVLSTDLDKWTVTEVPAMIDEGAEKSLLPWKKTLDLLKSESGVLRITTTTTTLEKNFLHAEIKLEVGGVQYDFPTLNPTNFPLTPDIPEKSFVIPGADLKAVLGRVQGSISKEPSRYTLNGACFDAVTDKLNIVATDGHRLALDALWVEGIPKGKAIVPYEGVAWLYKHSTGDVDVTFGETQSFFHLSALRTTLIVRNLTSNFPNYQAVIPQKKTLVHSATFPLADVFAKTLAKVAQMSDDRSGAVKVLINGAVTLSASSCDHGKASATVVAKIKHPRDVSEVLVGFNSEYILELLKIAGKGPIVLSLKDQQSAGVFTIPSLPEYVHIVMPMRM